MKPTFKSVESHLNEVSYDIPEGYVPTDFALNFINFIKLVNGTRGEESITPFIHYVMLDQLVGRTVNIANLCSRGLAKSSLFAEYLILYLATYKVIPGFGSIEYILYVSDSMENGVKKMRNRIERRRLNSEFLMTYIPEVRITDNRWYFKNVDGSELVVTGHGAKTGVRGTVELNTRPQLAILDDLFSDDDARSPTVIASVEDTIYKAIDFALHPKKQKIIWSGTPFNAKDPLYKAIESGVWIVNVFPVCEKFPCTREEFKGAWPDRFDYDYVKGKYDKAAGVGKLNTFNQELMLRIMSEEERLITDDDISWYSLPMIMRNRASYNFYITTDFATSEKTSADFSVISVWALGSDGDWFWVDGVCKKQLMDKNIDDLFRLIQEYKPLQVGIEVSGQQGGFIEWIKQEKLSRKIFFTLASDNNGTKEGIRPNTDKMTRFQIVVPLFKSHKVHFPKELKRGREMKEALEELSLVTFDGFKSKHDDFIDTISMIMSLKTFRPSGAVDLHQKRDKEGIWHMEMEDEDDYISTYIV